MKGSGERGILTHANKCGCFVDSQTAGRLSEVDIGSRLDTYGIVQKIEIVEIERQNLFFRVVSFYLDSDYPLDGFLEKSLHGGTCGL